MSVSKVLADLSQKVIDEYLNTLSGRLLRPCDSSLLILFDKLQRISLSYRLLIESDSGYESLPILLRTIYETQLYIKYLLDDRDLFVKRGQAYYYSNYQGVVNQVVANLHAYDINQLSSMKTQINKMVHDAGYNVGGYQYFNIWRFKFCNCFDIPNKTGDIHKSKSKNKNTLFWKLLEPDAPFVKWPLDNWDWYNEDGKTFGLDALVCKLSSSLEYDHALIYKPACIDVHAGMDVSRLLFKRSRIYTRYPHDLQWDRFVDFSLFDSICLLLNTFSDQFSQEFINHVEGIAFAIFGVKYSKPSYLIKRLRADGVLINEGSNRIKEVN